MPRRGPTGSAADGAVTSTRVPSARSLGGALNSRTLRAAGIVYGTMKRKPVAGIAVAVSALLLASCTSSVDASPPASRVLTATTAAPHSSTPARANTRMAPPEPPPVRVSALSKTGRKLDGAPVLATTVHGSAVTVRARLSFCAPRAREDRPRRTCRRPARHSTRSKREH
jgi:hypothetical protein